jgi:exosortase
MLRSVSFSDQNDYLSCAVFLLVSVWVAGFVLSYGTRALRAARFPLSFLILMVPMPTIVLDRTVGALQRGSADVTHALLRLAGVPFVWGGLGFLLGGFHFEIAKECSGIHSTLILFVIGIVAGHLFLRSIWGKVCFSVFTVLVSIFKNAVRIVTIACLTVYVDRSFSDSWLHRKGGVVFAALGLAIVVPSLLALQRVEPHLRTKQPTAVR